ncbi:MAG: MBOAT family protein [Cyanobacteria bacterium TGS_CYA1]|nr:MBOAT family protein [Cyanobacteria bacterium TGS_CYA1]
MSLFNWLWGNLLDKSAQKKLIFGIGVGINLLCLGIFKYAGLVCETLNMAGLDVHWQIALPLAISFFTFEFIHYLFEIYRGAAPMKSPVLFCLFAAFFPTQIAGPIKRYQDFQKQMDEEKSLRLSYFDEGIPLIILGLAKKVLFADNFAIFVNMGYKMPEAFSSTELWIFAYAFAFQIYFDFSGYTDIARGSAMLFGYKIPINFNMPYIASNISNFWHRWHISLSSWLRDYLFIPLGGSRGSEFKTNRNLLITMTLGGLWHGASWSFVVWGMFHGLALIAHRQFARLTEKWQGLKPFFASKIWNIFSIILTFHVVCIGWVFFRVHDIGTAFGIVKKMVVFNFNSLKSLIFFTLDYPLIVPCVTVMVGALLLANFPVSWLNEKKFFQQTPAFAKALFSFVLIVLMVSLLPDHSEPFIYFQF